MSNQVLTTQDDPGAEENKEPVFVAEFETMDLSPLKNLTFLVAASKGDRSKGLFLCTTARGPYDFFEMCEEVGTMYAELQHHPKVYIMEKDRNKRPKWLDENTVDFIECHWKDIITEGMLDGFGEEDKKYTCTAVIVEASDDDVKNDPQKSK